MKDSNGNDLPKNVMLDRYSSSEEALSALSVNSFLLAAKYHLQKGSTVIYSKEDKWARITTKNGNELFISHA